jgi:hypothetical protein
MITLYRSDVTPLRPYAVQAEAASADRDAESRTIYTNTCFSTEREAWQKIARDAETQLQFDARDLARLRKQLAEIVERTAHDVEQRQTILDGFAAFQRANGSPASELEPHNSQLATAAAEVPA